MTARALVLLRTDRGKVLRTVRTGDSDRKLRLLTWVLHDRTGAEVEARRILEEPGPDPKLRKALEHLNKAPGLLPPDSQE